MPKQKTITINGKSFTLQHPGARWYLQCIDRNKNRHGVLQVASYTEELLENVVVDPKVTVDDFTENISELTELTSKIESFLGSK